MKRIAIISVLFFTLCFPAWADTSYDQLVMRYGGDVEARGDTLKEELLATVPTGDLEQLWRGCFEGDSEMRASYGLALINRIYPYGDVSRWEEVSGMLLPQLIPKSLMAADAVLATVMALSDVKEGQWLSYDLLKRFASSSRAKLLFITRCPGEVSTEINRVVMMTGLSGYWKADMIVGSLPLARRIRKTIGMSRAVSMDAQFLNSSGVPSSNGPYAWDRNTGTIYRVTEPDRGGIIWYPHN